MNTNHHNPTIGPVRRIFVRCFGLLRSMQRRLHAFINIAAYTDVAMADEVIRKNIPFRGPNVLILACAIIIASVGLNVNSIPVIIGAMLVSPLMGPILGFGLGLGTNDMPLLRHSLKNLAVMVSISLVASTLYFAISPLRMGNPSELLARTQPTIYDVLIAFFGGGAGIIETARRERGTVIAGVAIATALMPPLCTIGYGLALFQWHYALGAFYLFCINCIFIALATFLGVKYLHFPVVHFNDPKRQRRLRWTMSVVILLVMVPSIITAVEVVKQNNFERRAEALVLELERSYPSVSFSHETSQRGGMSVLQINLSDDSLSLLSTDSLFSAARRYDIDPSQIVIRR